MYWTPNQKEIFYVQELIIYIMKGFARVHNLYLTEAPSKIILDNKTLDYCMYIDIFKNPETISFPHLMSVF